MAFIEGTTFSGYFSELTVVARTLPTSIGSGGGRHKAKTSAHVSTNRPAYVGASVKRYSPRLAKLLGTEDFA